MRVVCVIGIYRFCVCIDIFFCLHDTQRNLHSFPTRRSSDLVGDGVVGVLVRLQTARNDGIWSAGGGAPAHGKAGRGDRKSTRLNSSHVETSYAVFCLKKKRKNKIYRIITK